MLLVGFGFRSYFGYESSGSIEIAVTISGGLSATPISVMVTTTGQTATGKGMLQQLILILLINTQPYRIGYRL